MRMKSKAVCSTSVLMFLSTILVFVIISNQAVKQNLMANILAKNEQTIPPLPDKDIENMIETAKTITKSPVLVNFINNAYLPLAFNWLCKTQNMDIHDQVLIVTTQIVIKSAISKFSSHIKVVVVDIENEIQDDQYFNHIGYLRLMIRRTQILNILVQNDIETLLFEFDSLWIKNPLRLLASYKTEYDFLFVTNYRSNETINGGFFYMFPTNTTKAVLKQMEQEMLKLAIRIINRSLEDIIKTEENDQDCLSRLVREKYAGLRALILPYKYFADGIWYEMTESRRKLLKPYLIHNDYIVGNKNKIARMKKWGHWFLMGNYTCDNDKVNNFAII